MCLLCCEGSQVKFSSGSISVSVYCIFCHVHIPCLSAWELSPELALRDMTRRQSLVIFQTFTAAYFFKVNMTHNKLLK